MESEGRDEEGDGIGFTFSNQEGMISTHAAQNPAGILLR